MTNSKYNFIRAQLVEMNVLGAACSECNQNFELLVSPRADTTKLTRKRCQPCIDERKALAANPEARRAAIRNAVAKLNPVVDAHWTKGWRGKPPGLPDLRAIEKLAGFMPVRDEVAAATDDYRQPTMES